jgi:hypothetical protein
VIAARSEGGEQRKPSLTTPRGGTAGDDESWKGTTAIRNPSQWQAVALVFVPYNESLVSIIAWMRLQVIGNILIIQNFGIVLSENLESC